VPRRKTRTIAVVSRGDCTKTERYAEHVAPKRIAISKMLFELQKNAPGPIFWWSKPRKERPRSDFLWFTLRGAMEQSRMNETPSKAEPASGPSLTPVGTAA